MTGQNGDGAHADARVVIKAAFLRLYAKHPLREMTVETLAREAGYSRAGFYNHFHSCADVLHAVEDDVLPVRESAYLVLHPEGCTSAVFQRLYLDYFACKQEELRILLARDTQGELYDKLSGTIFPAFYSMVTHRKSNPPGMRQEDAERLASYLVEVKMNQLSSWARSEDETPLAAYMSLPLTTVEKQFWDDRP